MDSEKLKVQLGKNIATYRKHCGMTQAELADKLNYSDEILDEVVLSEKPKKSKPLVK